jgi:CheY-like chemotaxis protein
MSAPKVLVADDSPLVLRMIEKMLQGAGFGVVTAKDGLEAVERAFSEDLGLVILDVMMPRMNGYQTCRLLKTEPATRHLPVIMLTSKDQAGDRYWGLETGADHYITKDADPSGILELVRKVAAAGAQKPRGPARKDSVDVLTRVNELLDRKLFEATILSELGRVARSLVNFDETFTSVMRVLTRLVDFTVGAMAFVDDDELDVYLLVHRPASWRRWRASAAASLSPRCRCGCSPTARRAAPRRPASAASRPTPSARTTPWRACWPSPARRRRASRETRRRSSPPRPSRPRS